MDPLQEINWFAVHAKRLRESFAASNVAGLGLEIFFPRTLMEPPQRKRFGSHPEPLFPGYFFARFAPPGFLSAVTSCPGVLHVVSTGRFPIPVEESVIREIRDRVEDDGLVRLRPQRLKPGDRIVIGAGPFEGIMGRVEGEADDRQRVTVLLETLWHARVLVERRWIQAEAA